MIVYDAKSCLGFYCSPMDSYWYSLCLKQSQITIGHDLQMVGDFKKRLSTNAKKRKKNDDCIENQKCTG